VRKGGNCKAAIGHLGKGLHSIQDKYAHPAWYDDWNDPRNRNASQLTEIKTKKYLMRFIQLTR